MAKFETTSENCVIGAVVTDGDVTTRFDTAKMTMREVTDEINRLNRIAIETSVSVVKDPYYVDLGDRLQILCAEREYVRRSMTVNVIDGRTLQISDDGRNLQISDDGWYLRVNGIFGFDFSIKVEVTGVQYESDSEWDKDSGLCGLWRVDALISGRGKYPAELILVKV